MDHVEIERRFRVNLDRLSPNGEDGKHLPQGRYIKQGYLAPDDPSIRIRLVAWDDNPITSSGLVAQAILTIKGKGTVERAEWNILLANLEGYSLQSQVKHGFVEKVRHEIVVMRTKWELDKFVGAHEGLWLAEVELPARDAPFDRPPWLGEEVTEDTRYSNAYLASHAGRFWE
jgi:adenylate cyclase